MPCYLILAGIKKNSRLRVLEIVLKASKCFWFGHDDVIPCGECSFIDIFVGYEEKPYALRTRGMPSVLYANMVPYTISRMRS